MTANHRYSAWDKLLKSIAFLSALLLVWPGLIFFAGGLILFLYEFGLWLRNGQWPVLRAEDQLSSLLPSTNPLLLWLRNPESWHGLHSLVSDYSLSLILVLMGVVGYALGFFLYKVTENIWRLSNPS